MNIGKEIQKAKANIELIVLATTLLKTLEELFPEDGKGKEKLALFRQWLEELFPALGGLLGTFEENWPRIEKWVEKTVTTFNRLGLFKKSASKPA